MRLGDIFINSGRHEKFPRLTAGRRVILDLGELRNVADVALKGRHLGILWKPPFQVDVTDVIHSGKNQLEIEITNTRANRLVGDARLPEAQRITRLAQNLPIQGPRESGLLGPVRLCFESCGNRPDAGSGPAIK